jgi:HlyD family secretion protein
MLKAWQRHWPWWTIAVLVLCALLFQLWPRGREVEVVAVERGPIVQSVVATGRIATPAQIAVSSQIAARIESIVVREGDAVRAGQPLVRLRDDEARAVLASARAALREAEARSAQLRTVQRPVAEQQLVQAQATLTAAERELERARELVARSFVSHSRLDDAQRQADSARAALASARAQAQGLREGGVEADLARARIEQARASLASAEARLDTLVLRAPADGTVLVRHAEPGDTAQVGDALLTIAQRGMTRIIAQVDEKNLRWLGIGQRASALADAFPNEPFEATLIHVAPSVDLQRATVEVWLQVSEPPAFLRPDMTVSVEMVVGRREDALLLPAWALRDAELPLTQPKATVFVMRDGRAHSVEVELGLRGIGTVEIASGLTAGNQVIAPEFAVQEGDRVRLRRVGGAVNLRPISGLSD